MAGPLNAALQDLSLLPGDELFASVECEEGSDEAFLRLPWYDLYGDEPVLPYRPATWLFVHPASAALRRCGVRRVLRRSCFGLGGTRVCCRQPGAVSRNVMRNTSAVDRGVDWMPGNSQHGQCRLCDRGWYQCS